MKALFARAALVSLALVGAAGQALAQATPTMPDVTFPITTESVASKVSAAGGTILGLTFGVSIGFLLIRKLYKRVTRTV